MNNKIRKQNNRGAALLFFVIFFLFASSSLSYLISKSVYADLMSHRLLSDSKESYLVAEASVEDVAYRYIIGKSVDTEETLTINGVSATTTAVLDTANSVFDLEAISDSRGSVRKVSLQLIISSGVSFNFGVQTGNGGFAMTNTAKVIGNIFSNGTVTGQGASVVEGDVIASGPNGLVQGIHATGTVRSHEIDDSEIDGDAYYQIIDLGDTTVLGTLYPGSADEATSSLPFPDSRVDDHKASVTAAIAASEGTLIASTDAECLSGTYLISADTTFSNPTKIECNVDVESSVVLTLADTLWIEGNLKLKKPTIAALPVVSTTSVLIIVDNESDRINSSQIDIQNGTTFSASSSPKSYIMLVSMNEDAENGGHADPAADANDAISVAQSSNGDAIVYAGHGKISLANKINLKEVTGYLISMGNNSTIEYESGLINLNFTSGPGGGFELGSWDEVE